MWKPYGNQDHRKVYLAWKAMLYRCENKKWHNYKYYGGRGITVCERWHQFENFYADMGEPPTRKHTLERENPDGNYHPGNCRWATVIEQANNRTSNRRHNVNGVMMTSAELARKFGLGPWMVYAWLKRGKTIEEIVKLGESELTRRSKAKQ